MRVTVTGGAGFIGANLCRELVASGFVAGVVVLDDLSTGFKENLDGVPVDQLIVGSVLDDAALDEAITGADAVVHLAAIPSVPRSVDAPLASHHANATGTLMVLEAARRHGQPHVVVASSSSVYGANPTLPKHEGLLTQPLSPYAVSKQATEAYALAYQHCYGMDTLAFRFFNVFGPLQAANHAYAAVVPAFVSAALEGRPLTVYGDGTQTRDFTYVGTVTRVIADAVRRRVVSDGPINLAFGTRTSLLDLIDTLEDVFGRSLAREHHAPRAGDVPHSQADGTRLASLFPDVQAVPFTTGIRATVDWFLRQTVVAA